MQRLRRELGTPPPRSSPLWPQALVDFLIGQGGADAVPLKTGAELQEGREPVSSVCSVCRGSQAAAAGPPKQHSQGVRLQRSPLRSSLLRSPFSLLIFIVHCIMFLTPGFDIAPCFLKGEALETYNGGSHRPLPSQLCPRPGKSEGISSQKVQRPQTPGHSNGVRAAGSGQPA